LACQADLEGKFKLHQIEYLVYRSRIPDFAPKSESEILHCIQHKDVRIVLLHIDSFDEKIVRVLHQIGEKLAQIYFDEAHCLIHHERFRDLEQQKELMRKIQLLPKTFMTGSMQRNETAAFTEAFSTQCGGINEVPIVLTAGTMRTDICIARLEASKASYQKKIEDILTSRFQKYEDLAVMVFVRQHSDVHDVVSRWQSSSVIKAVGYHGGMSEDERNSSQNKFSLGEANCMVGTEACAAGIDIHRVREVFIVQGSNRLSNIEQMMG
jgi:superfamily II DNA helicase RecQ